MIAELALQDLSPRGSGDSSNRREQGSNQLGWSGPKGLVTRRGHVNWTGERKFSGPRLGPPSPRRGSIQHVTGGTGGNVREGEEDRRPQVTTASTTGSTTASTTNTNMTSSRTDNSSLKERANFGRKGLRKTIPHQGGRAYKSSLNYCFDNERTIQERMNEIYHIANYHESIKQERKEKKLMKEKENEKIARERRLKRFYPPILDSRTSLEKQEDDIMAQYTARRYRGPCVLRGEWCTVVKV